jgi:hypothetical protein
MNLRTTGAIALLAASAILGGCATSRSEIKVASPQATSPAPAVTKERAVVIRTIKDERTWAAAPTDPGIPSLGFEGAAAASEAVKARAVGRKRNTYGQALGDVLLQEGQTVPGLVRENLAAAFRQAGYRVAPDAASAGASPLIVDVSIRKFWTWLQPGFWALTFHGEIETDLTVTAGGRPTTIRVKTQDPQQVGTEAVWIQTVEKALAAYRAEAAGKLAGPPF